VVSDGEGMMLDLEALLFDDAAAYDSAAGDAAAAWPPAD